MNNKKTGSKSSSSGKRSSGHYVKRDSSTGHFTQAKENGKTTSTKSKSSHVIRDLKTGQYISVPVDKNAQMLAATVGGAIIGNILFPGIGGAIFGGITGAIVGGSKNKDPKK